MIKKEGELNLDVTLSKFDNDKFKKREIIYIYNSIKNRKYN